MANKRISQLPIGVLSGNTIFPIVSAGITSQSDLTTIGNFINDNFVTGGGTTFSGGTVTGPTIFTNGLTANTINVETISATTYLNLPISSDIYVRGWQIERELGNSITIGKGVGKLLLTNGSNMITGVDGVDFDNQSDFDSPFFYYEATVRLSDNTRRYISLNANTGSTIADIAEIYSDNRYQNALSPTWTAATGEYEYFPYFISEATGQLSHAEGEATLTNNTASHAEGYQTTAMGFGSHAEGINTIAGDTGSHVEGLQSQAIGQGSHAEGNITIASGQNSHAEGEQTQANGYDSHAEGRQTIASGDYSHVEGQNSVASGYISHAEGYGTQAIGLFGSHAEGQYSIASGDTGSHAEGYNTLAAGSFGSHAEGAETQANGQSSHAEGFQTQANAAYSHAEGLFTQANGNYSHAEGQGSIADGDDSHAEGSGTIASGGFSHAEGNSTIASGTSSHAEGSNTQANGEQSHAGGYLSTANGNYSFVHGSASTANGNNTVVLGANINGLSANTTYVDNLNIKTLPATGGVLGLAVNANGQVVTNGAALLLATVLSSVTFNQTTGVLTAFDVTGGTRDLDGFRFTGGTVTGTTFFSNSLSANTVSATTYLNLPIDSHISAFTFNPANYDISIYLNDGTAFTQNLSVLASSVTITGGTYNPMTGIITFVNNTGGTFNITGFASGFTDTFTTAATLNGTTIQFSDNIHGLNYYSVNLLPVLSSKTDVTLFNSHTADTNNPHQTSFANLTSTAHTHSIGDVVNLQSSLNQKFDKTGGTITGDIIAYTISAATYLNLPVEIDVYVTGGTYNNGTATYTNNTGGTFSVTGFSTGTTDSYTTGATLVGNTIEFGSNVYGPNFYDVDLTDIRFSGGSAHCITDLYVTNFHGCSPITVHDDLILMSGLTINNNLSTDTISATTYLNLPIDIRVTGGTYSNGTTTFTNNTGGTFSVINFFTGNTEIQVTGGTYSNGTITITNNTGGTFNITGLFTGNTDVYVTGGTYSNGTATFTNNTGGTFNVVGFSSSATFTGGLVTGATQFTGGLTANTLSATTITAVNYLGLPTDIRVTGGTYTAGTATFTNNTGGTFSVTGFSTGGTSNGTEVFVTGGTHVLNTGVSTFTNNTGGTFSVSGYFNPSNDIYVTGGTYSNGTTIFTNRTGGTFNVSGFFTGNTEIFATGGTYSNGTITITNNTGGTFNITGLFTGSTEVFVTGGTHVLNTGISTFTNNTGGTFNVNGYFNPSNDVFVTGGTYSNGAAIFTNRTGGTFNVTGFFTGNTEVFVTGGTYNNSTGTATFTNNTGGTFNVTGLFTGSTDIRVTGGTFNNGTATFTNNTGGTFNVTGITSTFNGGTVTGTTTFTAGLSANTISAITLSVSGTQLTKNHVVTEAMLLSTGAYSFSGITLGTGNTFSVGQAKGYIIDSTDPTNINPIFVSYSGQSGLTPFYLTSSTATYILVNSASTLTFTNTEPTPIQRRQNIQLGVIGHPNSSVTGVGNRPDLNLNSMSQVRDMFTPIRLINDGVVCTYRTGLTISNTAGTLYGLGLGYMTNGQSSPTTVTISAATPTTFQYRTQTGTTFANTTTISAATYDVSGTATSIPGTGSTATNQRIYLLENGNIRIQFGQTLYNTLTEAIVSSETFVVAANNRTLGLLIGILSITRDCTDLSNTSKARFLQVTKFGESVGSAANQMSGYLLASLTCTANADQTITNTATTIAFDTDELAAFGGIARSGNTFLISSTGLYQFSLQPQILHNTNANEVTVWAQKNGVNVPRSGIKSTAASAGDSTVLPLTMSLDLVNTDQITFKAISSVANGTTLDFTASGATVPAIPACILDIKGWKK